MAIQIDEYLLYLPTAFPLQRKNPVLGLLDFQVLD
jgi:hypothetical protein